MKNMTTIRSTSTTIPVLSPSTPPTALWISHLLAATTFSCLAPVTSATSPSKSYFCKRRLKSENASELKRSVKLPRLSDLDSKLKLRLREKDKNMKRNRSV